MPKLLPSENKNPRETTGELHLNTLEQLGENAHAMLEQRYLSRIQYGKTPFMYHTREKKSKSFTAPNQRGA